MAFLALFSLAVSALQAQSPTTANQVKAVFLFNFTQFITWPSASFSGSNSAFVIAILGNDPFGSYLDKVVEGEQVAGHPIVVQRYNDAREVRSCQLLFINKENAASLAKDLNSPGMLTISDADNFARAGGMIQFYFDNHKIHFQINARAAKAASLTISSKLLRLADVIGD